MNIGTWITVLTLGVLVVLSPGPNWAVTIKNGIYSKRTGLATVFGMAAGTLIHISYCLIGIGVLVSQSILLFNLIKWAGAIYLIYIGVKSLFSKKNNREWITTGKKELTSWVAFYNGFLTDLLNPKATLFYLALFTQVIHSETPLVIQFLYGITVLEIEIIWYSLMVFFLNHHWIRKGFMSVSHWVERITGAILIGLGIRLFISKNEH
ncbi:LysE family transporter [Laceyella putida]|uniref:LysE family transporter n=1 Tax=Laceyella putida TaxID=110101 RepID=A0ABW2RM65_9BACL